MASQKKQAKEFFGKNYDDFTLKDVFDFSIGRLEYEEDHPEEKSKKRRERSVIKNQLHNL